eukprot:29337-Pelagococcus_subviridis.AAC.4
MGSGLSAPDAGVQVMLIGAGAFSRSRTGPHTTAFARCTPFLKEFSSRRVFLSAQPSLSIPTHRDTFQLTPFDSAPQTAERSCNASIGTPNSRRSRRTPPATSRCTPPRGSREGTSTR